MVAQDSQGDSHVMGLTPAFHGRAGDVIIDTRHSFPRRRPQVYVDTSGGDEAPRLSLEGTRRGGSSALPALLLTNASSGATSLEELTFTYTVLAGDRATGALEITDRDVVGDGAPVLDLLGREANTTLPAAGLDSSLSATAANITIDTSEPVIFEVRSLLEGGEYGVGQVGPSIRSRRAAGRVRNQSFALRW